jgi:TolA-binding protein
VGTAGGGAATTAAVGSGVKTAATAAVGAKALGVAGALKVVALVAVAGGTLLVGGRYLSRGAESPTARAPVETVPSIARSDAPVAPAPSLEPVPSVAPAAPAPELPVEAEPADPPAEPAVPASPQPPAPARRPRPVDETDALTRELETLDLARQKLQSGDAAGALAALKTYERSFPRGALANEATLVRLEALLKAGRSAEAEALGRRFLQGSAPDLAKQRARRVLDAAR